MFAERLNYINVVGDNNVLLHGRVMDVAEDGLYIDLLCPNRRRELIPFNRAFLSNHLEFNEWSYGKVLRRNAWTTLPVEVLRREHPGEAWRWWPGMLVNPGESGSAERYGECTVAVVQGRGDSGAIWTDILPKHRVRFPSWREDRDGKLPQAVMTHLMRTGPGCFVKRSIPLPLEWREVSAAQLWQEWMIKELETKREIVWRRDRPDQVVGIDVADELVHFIVELNSDDGVPKAKKIVRALYKALLDRLPGFLNEPKLPFECLHISGATEGSCVLGVDEWQHVLSHLDILTQTKLRAVCPAWNAILDSPALMASIVIEATAASQRLSDVQYILAAPIFTCLCSFTKHVIIHDREHAVQMLDVLRMLEMIHYVGRTRPGISLTALYLVGVMNLMAEPHCGFEEPDQCGVHRLVDGFGKPANFKGFMDDLIAARRGLPCVALHLVRSRVRLRYEGFAELLQNWDGALQLDVNFDQVRLPLSGDFASTLWNAVEAALSGPSKAEIRALSKWLKKFVAEESHRMAVCKVLCLTQTADPRPSLQYRGRKWCTKGDNLYCKKLSRIALHFLMLLHRLQLH